MRRRPQDRVTYAVDRFQMGDVISFVYNNPKHHGVKNVILLTPNWMGNLHGLKVEYLTPTEQEYLQMVCRSIKANKAEFYEPLKAMMNEKLQQLEVLKGQTSELIKKKNAVVVKPADEMGMFGQAADKARKILGSVIGTIKTFGATQKQQVPVGQDPAIAQQIQLNEQKFKEVQEEYYYFKQVLDSQKKLFAQIGKIPDNPYHFYHLVIKSLIPRHRRPTMYRKYKVKMVGRERIIRSIGL